MKRSSKAPLGSAWFIGESIKRSVYFFRLWRYLVNEAGHPNSILLHRTEHVLFSISLGEFPSVCRQREAAPVRGAFPFGGVSKKSNASKSHWDLGLPRYCAGALNRRDLIYGMSLLRLWQSWKLSAPIDKYCASLHASLITQEERKSLQIVVHCSCSHAGGTDRN